MDSSAPHAPDESAGERTNTGHWALLAIPLAAALILGVTCFIWVEVLGRL